MVDKQYHATYLYSREPRYLTTYDDNAIVALRKSADGEYPSITNLVVVYGVLIEFEPAKVVETYKIKD